MNSEDPIVQTADGRLWCNMCSCFLPGTQPKNVKQHIKSITHKKAQKGVLTPTKRTKEKSDEAVFECPLCDLVTDAESTAVHPSDPSHGLQLQESDEHADVCLSPPFISKPALRPTHPFITFLCGTLTYDPRDLPTVLEHYCVGGPGDRLPNIDVNLKSQEIKSWTAAKRILQDAHESREVYWAAFNINEHITNPKWWPKDKAVPGYTQVIVGSGPTDIGIHRDQFGCDDVPVDTYITIAYGMKTVLMLPPDVNKGLFPEWFANAKEAKRSKSNFPVKLTNDQIKNIKECGGFYFRISPIESARNQVTLFVPKGWYHWLLGGSKWAVIFGSSAF